jgi:hypothetical protein
MSLNFIVTVLLAIGFGIPIVYGALYMIGLLFGTLISGFKEGGKRK